MQLSNLRSIARVLYTRFLRATLYAALPVALLITSSASQPQAATPAHYPPGVGPTGWIEVLRTTPISYLSELEADWELDQVSKQVASYVRAAGGESGVQPNLLVKHLLETFPRAEVSFSSDAMEYYYYVDQDGKLVRVCVSVTELTMTFTKTSDDIVVLVRKQMEV